MGKLHLIKLSVGSESVDSLQAWYNSRACRQVDGQPCHITRMWPKREAELLDGGSIYWVIKGVLQARTRLLGFEEVIGADGIRRCAMMIDPKVIRTETALKRPFQGWRYLNDADAPADLRAGREREEALPVALSAALAEIGVR
ncbi:DUF1489 family protein [Pseudaestuariivita atlantica]|uniref:Lysophospholipase n=1 Tax=Pseudaestuariivita atlantica TaxID=1317121 RepID=A0A0L1JRW9_9RHOB|nr:DUF1489 domain-containing protein [Pseudaestuariivita atlantica]KNG94476.1 lysophospholipase [Pseudaestuariivita atlantica]